MRSWLQKHLEKCRLKFDAKRENVKQTAFTGKFQYRMRYERVLGKNLYIIEGVKNFHKKNSDSRQDKETTSKYVEQKML